MFKKFVIGLMAALLVTQPALAGKYGGGSFSSSRSYSSGSSYRSSYRPTTSYSSYSSYRPSTSYSRPATAPRFSSGPSYNTARPAQTRVVSRPSGYYNGYNRAPVTNNYYGNNGYNGGSGFGHSFAGAFSGSVLGNMLFGNHNQTPVVVNGGGYAQAPMQGDGGYVAAPVVNNGPGFFGMIFWGIVNLLTLVIIIAAIVWIYRKVRDFLRNKT